MTVLIGIMQYVLENKLKQNLLFLFQPAEEGYGGAKHIISTGIFDKFKIKAAYALHVTGQFPTGTIGVKPGIIFGIPQEFDIEFRGVSGHVATPQKGKDAFLAALAFYREILLIICKRFPAQEPVIFHVGKATAGTVRNITPEYCKLEGTTRSIKQEVRNEVNEIMKTVAKSIELSHDVSININLLSSYDPVINDDKLTAEFIKSLPVDIKVENVDYSMTGEDFGFFSGMYPSVLFWLGADADADLHSSKFLPDEKCIDIALSIYKNILNN
jgi:N-acetyldiaminopimelate deacetylase